jgi:hypothetical protein
MMDTRLGCESPDEFEQDVVREKEINGSDGSQKQSLVPLLMKTSNANVYVDKNDI